MLDGIYHKANEGYYNQADDRYQYHRGMDLEERMQ